MKNKSTANKSTAWLLILFFLSCAVIRALNIYKAGVFANGTSDTLYSLLDVSLGIAVIISYALALAATVNAALNSGAKAAFGTAGAACAVIFADRAFCLVWDVSKSNIALGERGAFTDAALWLTVDFLFFAVTFFASVIISRSWAKKNATKAFPYKPILLSSLVMTALQLASQLVICVQFFIEYDDVTVTEMSQMAGDLIYVLFRYGVLLFGASCLFWALANGKKQKKMIKD